MTIGAKLLVLIVCCLASLPNVLSSHFRGGIIMVRPTSNGYVSYCRGYCDYCNPKAAAHVAVYIRSLDLASVLDTVKQ